MSHDKGYKASGFAILLSLLFHLILLLGAMQLKGGDSDSPSLPEAEQFELTSVDIDLAPEVPEAFVPQKQDTQKNLEQEVPDDSTPPPQSNPPQVTDPEPTSDTGDNSELVGELVWDAGLPDARMQGEIDAGLPDTQIDARVVIPNHVADASLPDATLPDADLPDATLPDALLLDARGKDSSTPIALDASRQPMPDAGLSDANVGDANFPDASDRGIANLEIADAGLSPTDASAKIASSTIFDAGQPSPASTLQPTSIQDAATRTSGIPQPNTASNPDAGLAGEGASVAKDGGSDAGTKSQQSGESNSSQASANQPSWANLELLNHTPARDNLAVLLRLDRLRGTEWSDKVAKILQPMPDHRLIIGNRKIDFADNFDMLAISTRDPRDLRATNLAAVSKFRNEKLRQSLSHKGVRLTWQPVSGGAVGRFAPSPMRYAGDTRVYLEPSANLIVLANPKSLGSNLTPREGALDLFPASGQGWVGTIPTLDTQSRGKDAPIAIASISKLPGSFAIPGGTSLRAPKHLRLSLELHKQGFVLRGVAKFTNSAEAAAFAKNAEIARKNALSSLMTSMLLRQFQAYNLLAGLKMKQKDKQVSFSSSLSIADMRSIMLVAADWSKGYFSAKAPR